MCSRRTPRGRGGWHVETERAVKARNHSSVAEALPHSEGSAYKPPCGEIALCRQVGRMGARRQLLLPLNDNYFCRRRVSKGVPLATAAALGNCCGPVAGRV